jgi:hypothetical protein
VQIPFSDSIDDDPLVRELVIAHTAEINLVARLAAAVGTTVRVRLAPCPDVVGRLVRVGTDHLWVADQHGFWLVAAAEIDAVSAPDAASRGRIEGRGMISSLRELLPGGRQVSLLLGAKWLSGAARCVGADFVEIDRLMVPLARIRACRVWY